MRKTAFLLFVACALSAAADGFAGLMFTDQSGAVTSVAVDGLRMTFDGDRAVIVNGSGSAKTI